MVLETGDPLAWLLTFTTFGTWLHGDPRGSTQHEAPGRSRSLKAEPGMVAFERAEMAGPAFALDSAQRAVVLRTIQEVSDHRGWELLALNVLTSHVHGVCAGDAPGRKMMADWKSYATRRLREHGLATPTARVWTASGSVLRLFSDRSVFQACDYVLGAQGSADAVGGQYCDGMKG